MEYVFQKEHLAIRERKKPDEPIDINDLKSLRFTRAVRIKFMPFQLHYSVL